MASRGLIGSKIVLFTLSYCRHAINAICIDEGTLFTGDDEGGIKV